MVQNNMRVTILPKNECTVQAVMSVTVPVKEEVKQILKDKCIREAAENFLKNFGDIKINTDQDYSIVRRVVWEFDTPITLNTINGCSKRMEEISVEFIEKLVEFLEACRNYKAHYGELPQQKTGYKKDLAKKDNAEKAQCYDVVLEGYNHNYKLTVAQAIKTTLNISIKQVVELISDDNLPAILSTNIDQYTAYAIKTSIEKGCYGCTKIVIKPTDEQ